MKWFAIAAALLLLLILCAGGVLAWRVTRVPAWYTAALNCPQWPADDVEKQSLIPMRNWIARMSAGDFDAKPDADKRRSIELSEDQINALLAKWTDNLHGDIQLVRVNLHENNLTVIGQWSAHHRAVGMNLKLITRADGSPALVADRLLLGEQPLPRTWVLAEPIRRMQNYLNGLRLNGKTASIDDHDIATKQATRLFFARSALLLMQGEPAGPNVMISPQLAVEDAAAMRVTQLRIDGNRLIIDLRMLNADERAAWARTLAEPLPAKK